MKKAGDETRLRSIISVLSLSWSRHARLGPKPPVPIPVPISPNWLVAAAVGAYVAAVVAWRPVRIVHLARVEGICLGAIAFRVLHERGPSGFIAEAIGLLTDLLTDIALCPLALAGSESKCIEVLVLSGHRNCRTEQQSKPDQHASCATAY